MNLSNLIEIISGVLIIAMLFAMIVFNISLRNKLVRTNKLIKKHESDNMMLLDEIVKLQDENDSLKILESDGFIKFLSESREWAFEFIEEFQTTLKNLEAALKTEDTQKILEEFSKLRKFLPDSHNT